MSRCGEEWGYGAGVTRFVFYRHNVVVYRRVYHNKGKPMFFTLRRGETINVNAIKELPPIKEGADNDSVVCLKMVDGSDKYVHYDDFEKIHTLAMS